MMRQLEVKSPLNLWSLMIYDKTNETITNKNIYCVHFDVFNEILDNL